MIPVDSVLETICGGFPNLHEIWAVPIELGLALWLLYRELGLSFLSPAAIAFISTACVLAISPLVGAAQKRWNKGIQTRVNITTDVLGSIKVGSFQVNSQHRILI